MWSCDVKDCWFLGETALGLMLRVEVLVDLHWLWSFRGRCHLVVYAQGWDLHAWDVVSCCWGLEALDLLVWGAQRWQIGIGYQDANLGVPLRVLDCDVANPVVAVVDAQGCAQVCVVINSTLLEIGLQIRERRLLEPLGFLFVHHGRIVLLLLLAVVLFACATLQNVRHVC